MSNGKTIAGLEVTIGLYDKIASKMSTHFYDHFDGLLETAADCARKLPDNEYANRDIKRKFLESMFLHEHKCYGEERTEIFYDDEMPKAAKVLFKALDNKIYGEFKKHLISKAVLEKNIMIADTDSLLDGVADSDFKSKILSLVNAKRQDFNIARHYATELIEQHERFTRV